MNPHLTDWTPDDAIATAAAAGLRTLGKHHWRAIAACRELAFRDGELPSIQTLAAFSHLAAEDLQKLFGDTTTLLPAIAGLTGRLPESLIERSQR